jgi:asparagine synthetase B (glutamine-hydrolysing)
MWSLSNILTKSTNPSNHLLYSFEVSGDGKFDIKHNKQWLIAGHVHSRRSKHAADYKLQGIKLVEALYDDYGTDFIQHLTGQFIIIHLEPYKFTIYSDHFAIKKFFIWQSGNEFILSDDLKAIRKRVHITPSITCIANYAIDYHFTGGTTAFENVRHNEPGQVIDFKDGSLSFSNYWQPADLLRIEKRKVSTSNISESLSRAIDSGLHMLDKDKISLSLTGGADTRNLLAIFLSKGIKPHLYTYGNPNSDDCIKAKAISDGLGLSHSIHDIKMTADLFEEYARKIIKQSGGIASIHRAHRIIAVEREKEYAKNMFLGTLGGEFIKGVSEDDYIVPAIVYENWQKQNFTLDQLRAYLQKKFIKIEEVDVAELLTLVKSHPYMYGNITERKHNALSHITAHLHDAQDVNLYGSEMQDVFTPFLNIDYLELIFSSQFTFDNKEKIENKYLKRVNNPVYASNFIKATYPPLLNYLYSGDHLPADVIFNKYYAALMKIYRKRKTKGKYQPNFPLGKWMEEFVEKNLPLCNDHLVLKETFDLDGLLQEFNKGNHQPKESYWLKFTNPIMMRFIIEEYTRS